MAPEAVVIYHGPYCRDGFCAAWVAYRFLRPLYERLDFLPLEAGAPAPDVNVIAGRDVYVFDTFFKMVELENIGAAANRLVVRDHHKTAWDIMADEMGEPRTRMKAGADVLVCVYKSGGRLAWEYFSPDVEPPALVLYTEDRDLWSWKLPFSREVNAVIEASPMTFAAWNHLGAECEAAADPDAASSNVLFAGKLLVALKEKLVAGMVANAREAEIDGHKVLVTEAPVLQSEVGEKLAEGRPFGATYYTLKDGRVRWSLRSACPGGEDVSKIAKARGGGGHRHAAGFTE